MYVDRRFKIRILEYNMDMITEIQIQIPEIWYRYEKNESINPYRLLLGIKFRNYKQGLGLGLYLGWWVGGLGN